MSGAAISKYLFMLKYFPNRYKTHNMCNKAVDTYLFVFDYIPNCYKSQ